MVKVYSIAASGTFERDFKKLAKGVQERIDKKIRWAAIHPEMFRQSLKHLPKDLSGLQKLRVGNYRVLLWVDHAQCTLTLYAVAHRSAIYHDL